MSLPTIDITGNLTRQLDSRFSQAGTCIASGAVAANKSKRLDDGSWETVDTLFQNFTVFGTLAEELANLPTGTKVRLIGTLRTEQWADKQTGEKRSANKLIVDFAHVYRDRNQGGPQGGQNPSNGRGPQNGPNGPQSGAQGGWGASQSQQGGRGQQSGFSNDDQPPF